MFPASRRFLVPSVFFLLFLAFAMPTAHGEEFFCKICAGEECSSVMTNEYGWANCFTSTFCYEQVACNTYSCTSRTVCRSQCQTTESCYFAPTGW